MENKKESFEELTYRKVALRILPLLMICYITAYLDRINVGFAKLQMLDDLGFSELTYGLGAGLFFIGYFIFEIPSNIILHKIGAKIWICRIMVVWGLISALMIFVTTPTEFYWMRFLLGAAEAGFFPGIILYLTYWFPSYRRAHMNSVIVAGIPIAGMICGIISGIILEHFNGIYGLADWKWLFLIEAIPSIIFGILVFFLLDDKPKKAKWLSSDEKNLLINNILLDERKKEEENILKVLFKFQSWWMSAIYFCIMINIYGIGFWMPSMIKNIGILSSFEIGVYSSVPYAISILVMQFLAKRADKFKQHRLYVAISILLCSISLVMLTIETQSIILLLLTLTIGFSSILSAISIFWVLPTHFLKGVSIAASIALINSLGNISGFVGPYIIGWFEETTKSLNSGIYFLASCSIIGFILILLLPSKYIENKH
jgi:MFS family permease